MQNSENKPGIIEIAMYVVFFISIFSSLVWISKTILSNETGNQTWYYRFSLGIIALGMGGIMREIRKTRNNENNIKK